MRCKNPEILKSFSVGASQGSAYLKIDGCEDILRIIPGWLYNIQTNYVFGLHEGSAGHYLQHIST